MSLPNVLCISLNPALDVTYSLPVLTLGKVNRAQSVHKVAAGKAINVAGVLSVLKERYGGIGRIGVVGFLGIDNQSLFLDKLQALKLENLNTMVAGQTRQNIKLSEQDGQVTDINGVGFVVDEQAKVDFFSKLESALLWADWVVVSGSLPVGFSLADFKQMLALLKSTPNIKWALDSSGQALATGVLYQPTLIKPNIDELSELIGAPCLDVISQYQALRKFSGITEAVVSMGASGVHWFFDKTALQASSPKVQVKSTVGAGDTLLAGILYGLLTKEGKAVSLKRAVALAADAVGRLSGVSDNAVIEVLASKVVLNEINLADALDA